MTFLPPSNLPAVFAIQIIAHEELPADQLHTLLLLCAEAYDEPFSTFEPWAENAVHVLGFLGKTLVSHAMWVERLLQPQGMPLLRTAYIEAVATLPAHQQQGYGTAIMRRLQTEIARYDLGGLSENPDYRDWYQRLGWEPWRGPLLIRTDAGLLSTPDEYCMILRLPQTPPLDLDDALSAEWRTGELW
jgi:aminoglycoside 2'-N-acetyltransferase I